MHRQIVESAGDKLSRPRQLRGDIRAKDIGAAQGILQQQSVIRVSVGRRCVGAVPEIDRATRKEQRIGRQFRVGRHIHLIIGGLARADGIRLR